jgi:predicted acyl esterase
VDSQDLSSGIEIPGATVLAKEPEGLTAFFDIPIYGEDALSVPYRKALPVDAPRARYTGLKPETRTLLKGTVRRVGAKPLPVDIILERDVALKMRDGTTIYTDVFRPATEGKNPAIVAWGPYGKQIGGQWLDDVPGRAGVPLEWVSELQKFEGPDPAFWVAQGYVVLNPDPRGAYNSEGNISYWGRQLAEDGYDFIEWAAQQSWCSGKIGMAGNSWLAVSQWFIAAERPPSLAAIAPWEGFADHFRDAGNRGGIPAPAFSEAIIQTFAGNGYIEDQPKMIAEQQLICSYWNDKIARLDRIEIPAYVVASYTNAAHTHGSFEGYRKIASRDKWLRVNNTNEWLDFYTPKYEAELLAFFDHFLKGVENDFKRTPKVRICVLDPSGTDIVDRVEPDWPLARAVPQKLFLDPSRALKNEQPSAHGRLSYLTSSADQLTFSYAFSEDAEITGYMSLRLWVEVVDADDMELSVTVEKRDAEGNPYNRELGEGIVGPVAATGLLRVSQRELDPDRSTPAEPYHTHAKERLLSPGEIVSIDISIWPMSMKYRVGEELYLTIAPHRPMSTDFDMGFGAAHIEIAESEFTFAPDKVPVLKTLGGTASTSPPSMRKLRVPTPTTRNRGTHIFHVGGEFDSHLLIPVVPA